MSDNISFRDANGGAWTLRTKDLGTGHAYYSMIITAIPTIVAGNQTLSLGTGSDTTLTVPSGATHALVTVDTTAGSVRYWEDGSSPSSSAGLLIPPGAAGELTNLANVKLRATAVTTPLNVSYRKYA